MFREKYRFFLLEVKDNLFLRNDVILGLSNSRRPVRQAMGSSVCRFVGK